MDVNPTTFKPRLDAGRLMMSTIIVGNDHAIKLALACIFIGRGFLARSDPGLGKTALSLALQKFLIDATHHVITNTPQLKPTDIIGQEVRNPATGKREKDPNTGKYKVDLRKAMKAHVLVSDELNRATEDAQSAYLWLLENQGAWIGDEFFELPEPHSFLATCNYQTDPGVRPMIGPLLNRMAVETEMWMPPKKELKDLIRNTDVHRGIFNVRPCLELGEVLLIRDFITNMVKNMPEPAADYLAELVILMNTRQPDEFRKLDFNVVEQKGKPLRQLRFGQKRLTKTELSDLPDSNVQQLEVVVRGVSPRGAIWISHLAAALAFMDGRDTVDFSHIEEAWCAQTHQLLMRPVARSYRIEPMHILTAALDTVKY